MVDQDKLNQAVENSLDVLMYILKAKSFTKEQLTRARIASSVLSTGARYQATQNARLSMQIRVASLVLKDNKERRKYLAASSPELKLLQ